ncbi:choice-of-anchor Q domain-containing protein [Psychromonas sp. KJ10-2]|uniref:choice-of-anchor Q domain-containing protein n=1 Tax=Psychromonas sp. KJ10-2 TaxID=3391822 RepID=UPI0039B4E458
MVVHYDPSRIWFINNDISECITGIKSTGAFDVHITGNNIHGMKESASETHSDISSYQTGVGITAYNTGNIYISNNTITDAIRGIAYEAVSGYEADIKSNIIANLHDGAYTGNSQYAIMLKGDDTTVDNSDIENNLFYNPMRLHIDGKTYTDLTSLVSAGKCNDNGGSCLDTDPSFLDDKSYSLSSSSAAIDKGSKASSYTRYENLYGESITSDILGYVRTDTTIWDIGAYESSTGGQSDSSLYNLPDAPEILSIDITN